MLAIVLAGLMILTRVNANTASPDLPFAVAGTANTRLLWQRLINGYAEDRRSYLSIIPLISAISHANASTPSKSLKEHSALLADSSTTPSNVSTDYIILPSALAPLVFCYNLPGLSRDAKITLSLSDIADIFTGKLHYWSDIRLRQKNPDLPFIRQPIRLILRDDNCSENIALTEFLCNASDIWQLRYGLMSSMQNFKGPGDLSVYHTILPSGAFSLVNSVPYSIAYFLGVAPSLPTVSLQLQNGMTVDVTDIEHNKNEAQNDSADASYTIYPLIHTFHIVFKKNLLTTPYNSTVLNEDPLHRYSVACRLQVEIYRFLRWLISSESAKEILHFHGFHQINGKTTLLELNEMSCCNHQNLTASAEKFASEDIHLKGRTWGHIVGSKEEYRDIIFTLSTTVVILFVTSVVLLLYLRSHYRPLSEYIISIELMGLPNSFNAFQTTSQDFQLKSAAFLEYAFGSNPDCSIPTSPCASRNYRKSVVNTWVYADSILSTAPVGRQYKGVDVLLIPTNIRSTIRFMDKRQLKLKHYADVDHENVQLFYGLAKSSAAQNKLQRNIRAVQLKRMPGKQWIGSTAAQGYSESDFILPWIYYIVVEPCVRGSLFELLHSGQYEISQSIKLNLASDIASGMAYLHSKKLIHGRLSSLTCLLDSRWVIKVACWQSVENLAQMEFFPNKHSANRGISRSNLKICWQPEHLRLVWRSPAQLKNFIAAQENTRTVDHVLLRRDRAGARRSRAVEMAGTGGEESTGSECKSMACDVYSFGVILTEIWSLEVPFHTALYVYQHEYQLAEAICNKVYKLSISPNMPSKIREATEACTEHSERLRPNFRSILKTLASLVPKGRSVAHHMIRAAVARVNDLNASCTLREKEVAKKKACMCQKLDSLFPRAYSLGLMAGTLTPSTSVTPQDVLIAAISLDQAFLRSAALADEITVSQELQCLKQLVEKHANDPLLRCLAAPGGFENDGVCLISPVHGDVSTPGSEEVQLIIHFLQVICQVEREFAASNPFHPASHPKFCAVLHRARAFSGPLGAYLPCQFVYGGVLEDVLELKRYAKSMEVLVTSAVTAKIKHILTEFKDYTLTETHKVKLWGTKPLQLYVLPHCRSYSAHTPVAPYLLDRTRPAEEILKNLAPDDAQRLEYIKAEHNKLVSSGRPAPLNLSALDHLELLCCASVSARNRYYLFRFKVSKKKEARKAKRVATTENELVQKNQILRMITSVPVRMHYDDWVVAELRTADTSAQTLIFDCSHESEMRIMDQKNLARQLAMAFAHNRKIRPFPFHFMFTSLIPGTNQYRFFEEAFGACSPSELSNLRSGGLKSLEDWPFTVRSEHFSEVMKGRKLIYLSPNASRAFENGEFDHDATFVVGGIVDKAIRRPVTYARARRAGWECMRLPLERYVHWRSGNKTLTLVTIHAILATAKETNGDWKAALERNIPSRFLREHDSVQRDINRLFQSI
ncbi:hypothetical protein TcWFU_009212 [Taenia crassiceps]|uniref:RNA (guanine-9-)-methyltransferase domain-containing protein 1 n=1 Tax=Taenia crassiceps TaxID=6207 RepID=A0ABR4Q9V2_9CEST